MERYILREKSRGYVAGVFITFVISLNFIINVIDIWGESNKGEKMFMVALTVGVCVAFLISLMMLVSFQSAEFQDSGNGVVVGKVYPIKGEKKALILRVEDGKELEVECSKEHFHIMRVGDIADIKYGRVGTIAVPSEEVESRNVNNDLFRNSKEFQKWRQERIIEAIASITRVVAITSMFIGVSLSMYGESEKIGILLFIVLGITSVDVLREEIRELNNFKDPDVVYIDTGIVKELYSVKISLIRRCYQVTVGTENEEFVVEVSRGQYKRMEIGGEVKLGIIRGEDPFIV